MNTKLANSGSRAFTLIELLVAIAVLGLMTVVLAQLTDISSRSMNDGLRRADNFTKARAALDLVAQDIASGVFRKDLGAFRDASGNFSLAFYTRRPGIGGDRELSLIAYQTDPARAMLLRGGRTIPWSDTAGLGFGDTTQLDRLSTLSPADFQEIARGIVRLEIYFLDDEGNYQSEYQESSRALGVALATVDEVTLDLLIRSGLMPTLQGALSRQTPPQASSYQSHWGNIVSTSAFLNAYPSPILSGLRVFERVIPIP